METPAQVIHMIKDKDTPRMVRFRAVSSTAAVDNIYVRKPLGKDLGDKIVLKLDTEY